MSKKLRANNFISIPVDFGELEAHISKSTQPRTACILFAPYPPMGGAMSFSLVYDLFSSLQDDFDLICRFNYRGVGKSTGDFEVNQDGAMDGIAVINYCLNEYPSIETISLVGYSYGAAVAYNIHDKFPHISKYVGISPPFEMFPTLFKPNITNSNKYANIPKFFTVGTQDQFVPLESFQNGITKYSMGNQKIYDNRDHFWLQNKDLISDIQDWVRNTT
jgi:hypothetical protein